MGFLHCPDPAWQRDDFNPCITNDLLTVLLPTVVGGLSATYLLSSTTRAAIKRRSRAAGYQPLPTIDGIQPDSDDTATDADDDEFAEHLSLRHTMSHVQGDVEVKVQPPQAERVAVAIELAAVMAVLATFIPALLLTEDTHELWKPAVAVLPWVYTLALVLVRLFKSTGEEKSDLWDHTALIYMANFFFVVIPFRSQMIHPSSPLFRGAEIVRFAAIAVLCVVTISVRKGNTVVVQTVMDGLEPSKEPLASLWSLASYSWVDAIVWQGFWKPLEMKDIWNLRNDDLAVTVLTSFRQTKKCTALTWTLMKHFKRDLVVQAIWAAFASLFVFAPTLLLRVILEYVEEPEKTPKNVAWLFVALMLVTGTIVAVGQGQALFIGRRICIRLRAVIIGEVYAKALRRKASGGAEKALGEEKKVGKDGKEEEAEDGQTNVGAIINLMAVDSFKVSEVCAYLHFLIAAAPVQFITAVVLLYQILGWSSIAGIGVMLLLMPVNYYISSQFSTIQKKIMTRTDKRIHTTNEVLQNIRIIKYFAWEERFGHVVNDSRTAELKQLWRRYVLWAIAATSWYGSPMLITFLSFLCYTVVEKKELNAPIAFTALSLFNVLRVPLDQLADMITNVLQTKVSVDRVEEFLREEETEKYIQLKHVEKDPYAPVIGFKDATLSWGSKKDAVAGGTNAGFQLQNLDIAFTPGKLNVVAGPTGSGKTSLLMGLLGEMTHLKGTVHLPGIHSREDLRPDPETKLTQSVAYCAQQPWLVNDTIKQNILFASPYDEERYSAVLSACSLERDLTILDHGDETEVGEKGISLSGGQKQRISLARALYSNAAHLLLDDCLSAVDSHTAKWIHEFCITGPLMQGRTCILVTHNVALCVPSAEKVIVMDNGRILMQGDPETVVKSGGLGKDDLLKTGMSSKQTSLMPSRVPSFTGDELTGLNGEASAGQPAAPRAKKEKMSKDEAKTEGGVSWRVYKLYLAAMGPWWYWGIVIIIFLAQQVGSVATSVWIREWAAKYGNPKTETSGMKVYTSSGYSVGCHASGSCMWALPVSYPSDNETFQVADNPSEVNVWYYLGIYALLGLAYTGLSFLREIIVFYGSLRASKNIHKVLMDNIMRAKFKFFDSTPLGRIMNRFSKDMEAIDQEVAPVALGMIHSFGSVVAIVILITIVTPGFFIAGIAITALYWLIGAFYLRASRDLKRIESIQRSPLYQHFGETLNGVSTIRAYGDERRFVRENLAKIDSHNRPFFYLWACNRWLGFRVDIAGAFVSFFAGVFVVLSVGKIDAGLAGLSLTYAITFTDNVLWVVRLYAMNEQNMNSVERVREYLEVEQEAPEIIDSHRPPAAWPQHGSVVFKNYSTRYRADLDLVLKDVSFTITPGQKVGIVGRTGAGKSSLTLALFRSLEAEQGSIEIDDIDIATIGLRDLRQSITMVPQDPTLFTGTIRSNLDPFGIHTDAEIFAALKRVQLIPAADPPTASDTSANKNIFTDLLSPVSESGNNLSQGQRQLVCLARALLRNPKVFIMDEATGSLDYETDTKIQETVAMMQSTIITIAHRLKSVAAYDKIVVLDQGSVVECAHPWELLREEGGVFWGMCESSGELETLRGMAERAWNEGRLVAVDES